MVIDIETRRNKEHLAGKAYCLHCKKSWDTTAPVGTYELNCPGCGTNKGVFKNLTYKGETMAWSCNCGNDLFRITPSEIYCAVCGAVQSF